MPLTPPANTPLTPHSPRPPHAPPGPSLCVQMDLLVKGAHTINGFDAFNRKVDLEPSYSLSEPSYSLFEPSYSLFEPSYSPVRALYQTCSSPI